MLVYFLLILFYIVLGILERRLPKIRIKKISVVNNRELIGIIDATALLLVCSLRSTSVGRDLGAYARWFSEYRSMDLGQLLKQRPQELTYYSVNKLAQAFGLDFHGYMIVYAAICVTILWYLLKTHASNYSLGFLIYITSGHLSNLFSLLRLELAVLLVALAASFLIRKKRFLAFIIAVLAVGAHFSAIIGVLVYIAVSIRRKKSYLVYCFVILLGVCCAGLFGLQWVLNFYSVIRKAEAHTVSFNGGVNFLLWIIGINTICCCACHTKGLTKSNDISIVIPMRVVTVGIAIQLLALYSSILTRAFAYFSFFYSVLIPNIVTKKSEDISTEIYRYGLIALWTFSFITVDLAKNAQSLVPYTLYH